MTKVHPGGVEVGGKSRTALQLGGRAGGRKVGRRTEYE